MKSSTQDKTEGHVKNAAGKMKAGVGEATGDRDLRTEGKADQAEGKTQKKVGDVKKVFDR